VIVSIPFKERPTWADEKGNPHSDQQHGIERWTRPDSGYLHVEMEEIDPRLYATTVWYQRTWPLGKGATCSEDKVDAPHLQPGPGPERAGWSAWR